MDFTLNRDCGQLYVDDRRWLYETVMALKPQVALETGTWKGGGSTFYIASALYDAGRGGVLYTIESNLAVHREACIRFVDNWPLLLPHVDFRAGSSLDVIPMILKQNSGIERPLDFVFLDSANDPQLMVKEFNLLAPALRVGGVLMAHDWHNGKADGLKPLVVDNPQWRLETIGDPANHGYFEKGSVGLAKLTKLSV